MSNLFDGQEGFKIFDSMYDEYPAVKQSDWMNGADSGSSIFKFSLGLFGIAGPDIEDKVCARTGVSMYEEFVLEERMIGSRHEQEEPQPIEVNELDADPSMSIDIEYRPRAEKRLIAISTRTICRRARIEKGDRFQTKNICKHLHTETTRYLRFGHKFHQFQQRQIELIRNFCAAKISINSFKTLLKNDKISAVIRGYYQSRQYVKEVMCSKMEMKAKLTMIKYLERIRSIAFDKNFKAWKKDYTEFQ